MIIGFSIGLIICIILGPWAVKYTDKINQKQVELRKESERKLDVGRAKIRALRKETEELNKQIRERRI